MAVLQIPEGDASVVKSRAQAGMTDSGTMVAETGDRVLYVTDLAEPLHNLVVQVVARHPRVLVTILRGVRLASDQLKSVAASLEQIMAESPPASPETDPAPYAGVMIAADPEEYVLLLAGPPQKVRDLAEFAHAVDGKSR